MTKKMGKKENTILEKVWSLVQTDSEELKKISTHVAVLNQEMSDVKVSIKEIKDGYITKIEFSPIQKIVYGLVGAVLLAVLGAILALVIIRGG